MSGQCSLQFMISFVLFFLKLTAFQDAAAPDTTYISSKAGRRGRIKVVPATLTLFYLESKDFQVETPDRLLPKSHWPEQ